MTELFWLIMSIREKYRMPNYAPTLHINNLLPPEDCITEKSSAVFSHLALVVPHWTEKADCHPENGTRPSMGP
jgi:hypothetical protein